ncbi:hypothetical protein [Candidatus Villigracilis saccharophilus]|nr:hypothetical protein [Anaerolineales bacterium]
MHDRQPLHAFFASTPFIDPTLAALLLRLSTCQLTLTSAKLGDRHFWR